jgi:hypothetical protein
MRTRRKNTVAAAVAVAALSLGLTACGDSDTDSKGAGSPTAAQTLAGTASKPASGTAGTRSAGTGSAGTGSVDPAASQSRTRDTSGGGTASTGSTGTAKVPACTYKDVKITMAKADETPTEHIVLTAANTSGRSCRLFGYPLIAFGDIQTAKDIPAVAKSKPSTPIVLKSGTSAYANVRVALGGVHEDNKVVARFNVNLFGADGPAEGSDVVTAPSGRLAVNEAAAKTGYWTYELRSGADDF